MLVIVEEYDPAWERQFQEIKQELESTLAGTTYISIEHVGSTSVVGLAAKPIIDVDIVVQENQLEAVKQALVERGGYFYQGDMGVSLRYAFQKQSQNPARNLYVCIEGCQSLLNHLTVRDMCRSDAEVRDTYGRKKLELARQSWDDVDAYCEAKNDILAWILEKAGWRIDDRNRIRNINTTHPRPR